MAWDQAQLRNYSDWQRFRTLCICSQCSNLQSSTSIHSAQSSELYSYWRIATASRTTRQFQWMLTRSPSSVFRKITVSEMPSKCFSSERLCTELYSYRKIAAASECWQGFRALWSEKWWGQKWWIQKTLLFRNASVQKDSAQNSTPINRVPRLKWSPILTPSFSHWISIWHILAHAAGSSPPSASIVARSAFRSVSASFLAFFFGFGSSSGLGSLAPSGLVFLVFRLGLGLGPGLDSGSGLDSTLARTFFLRPTKSHQKDDMSFQKKNDTKY